MPERRGQEFKPVSNADIKKFDVFKDAMLVKYLKGRGEHGTKVLIDPLTEAQNECLDLANYAMMEYYIIGRLKEKVDGLERQTNQA